MSAAQEEFNELMRNKEKRSQHPEDDDDDARSFLNLSDDDDDTTPPASQADPDEGGRRQSMSSVRTARSTIPTTRYGANTGPKGVISDAQNWRDSRRQHRNSMRSTSTLATQMQSGMSIRDQAPAEKVRIVDEEDDDEDELDSDFMDKWRSARLREMQKGTPGSRMHHRTRSGKSWGSMTTVDGEGYLDAVDGSGADTVVVVYIYDDSSDVSAAIEECIRSIARKHSTTRFVKLHYLDAEMEPAGVPAVLAYRGGDKFAGLVPVIQDIPDDAELSARTIEAVMKRHQILR